MILKGKTYYSLSLYNMQTRLKEKISYETVQYKFSETWNSAKVGLKVEVGRRILRSHLVQSTKYKEVGNMKLLKIILSSLI